MPVIQCCFLAILAYLLTDKLTSSVFVIQITIIKEYALEAYRIGRISTFVVCFYFYLFIFKFQNFVSHGLLQNTLLRNANAFLLQNAKHT